ncbi:leucine-rich repeat-containing protein 20 isoform X5 [Emydura macquarii macquarii]|uniref:leucine-rich repeat-containing protein 20 isoform X5 n=1 Tax=Emydura macquarii macquarii TaxID=1129001 RepID=UPI00352BA2A0
MEKIMGEAVARVARKVNETVENGADALDLADCKLMMFPIGIYKVMRNVTEGIHLITLANNELKSVTSKFITTFSQLRATRDYVQNLLPSLGRMDILSSLSSICFWQLKKSFATLCEMRAESLFEENNFNRRESPTLEHPIAQWLAHFPET